MHQQIKDAPKELLKAKSYELREPFKIKFLKNLRRTQRVCNGNRENNPYRYSYKSFVK